MENVILNNLDAYIYVADPQTHRLIYINRKYAEDRGLVGADGAVDYDGLKCWSALYGDRDAPCAFCPARELSNNPDTPVCWEYGDNTAGRHFQNISRAVTTPDGRPAMMTFSSDITDIKTRLIASENKRNDYMSRMSHEILTPMNAIIGMSKIAGSADDAAKMKGCLTRIDEASRQLMGVIGDVLDMSKLEAGSLELVYSEISLEAMFMEIGAGIMAQVDEKAQDFQVAIDADVPVNIRTDRRRLGQIISHLLLNAVKFTPAGGKIRLRASLGDGLGEYRYGPGADSIDISPHVRRSVRNAVNIVFTVSDNGIGVTEEESARMFDAFEQADGTMSRAHGGIGLGLAISQKLVRLLGGDIRVESEPNSGSTFTFNIIAEQAGGAVDSAHTRMYTPDFSSKMFCESAAPYDMIIGNGGQGANKGFPAYNFDEIREEFLPVFDVEAALKNLKYIKKLYVTLLLSLKTNPRFGALRESLEAGDLPRIGETASVLAGVARKLCMPEILDILEQMEAMVRHRIVRPELTEMYAAACEHIDGKLDDLLEMLNTEANN